MLELPYRLDMLLIIILSFLLISSIFLCHMVPYSRHAVCSEITDAKHNFLDITKGTCFS